MLTYYHWRTYYTFDGKTLIISDIDKVKVSNNINGLDPFSEVSVIFGKYERLQIAMKYALFETEKDAVKSAIKSLRRSIYLILNEKQDISNPDIWICKARNHIDMLFSKYCNKYPEIFI